MMSNTRSKIATCQSQNQNQNNDNGTSEITTKIEESIECNLKLQSELLVRLKQVATHKQKLSKQIDQYYRRTFSSVIIPTTNSTTNVTATANTTANTTANANANATVNATVATRSRNNDDEELEQQQQQQQHQKVNKRVQCNNTNKDTNEGTNKDTNEDINKDTANDTNEDTNNDMDEDSNCTKRPRRSCRIRNLTAITTSTATATATATTSNTNNTNNNKRSKKSHTPPRSRSQASPPRQRQRQRPPPTSVKRWDFSESRRWTRRFFIDPKDSIPEPNADTIQRRQWEGDLIGKGYYRFNPWSKDELELLKQCAEEVRQEQQLQQQQLQQQQIEETQTHKIVKDIEIDFHKVTNLIEQKLSKTKLTQKQIRKIQNNSYISKDNVIDEDVITDATIKLRLWTDYRNKFLYSVSPSINQSKMTKKESNIIRSFINKYNDKSNNNNNNYYNDHNNNNPPWDEVAAALNNSRTPYQCFHHAQTKLSTTVATLNEIEDDLLLKYVSAQGPQYVLNHHTATILSQRFFPHLTTRQLLTRINRSLLNPNFKNQRWNGQEERMLILGMRAYYTYEYPISNVAALLPNRSGKLIMDKWNRSLNPSYSSQPFTTKEDNDLVAAVLKEKDVTSSDWKVISSLFPSRNSRNLLARYKEITRRDNSNVLKRRAWEEQKEEEEDHVEDMNDNRNNNHPIEDNNDNDNTEGENIDAAMRTEESANTADLTAV